MPRALKQVKGLYEHVAGSGIWYVRYVVDGKKVRKAIGSRQAAIDELDRINRIRRSGNGMVAKSAKEFTRTADEMKAWGGSGVLLKVLIDDYLRHLSDPANPDAPSDLVNPRQRLKAIGAAFGDRPAGSIKPYEIEDWLRSMGRAPGTLNRYKSTFSSVYRHAKSRGKIEVNPVRDAQQFKTTLPVPRWLRVEEEARIRAVLQRWIDECPAHHQLTKLFLQCHPHELTSALGTGMRKGNQYRLRWEDVDFTHRRITLKTTKSGKPQVIPMIDDVYAALKELKALQVQIEALQAEARAKDGNDSIRMIADGRVFNIAENREWWKKALEEAKITDLRWHDLRHTFATRLMKLTGNLKLVQEACNHASITMTARYAHVSQTALADAMQGLNRAA